MASSQVGEKRAQAFPILGVASLIFRIVAASAYRITRERMRLHRHPDALAQALREVSRSLPFEGLAELEALGVPALVVASYDEADPGHPYAVAEAWAERLPSARLVSEEPGKSPLPGREAASHA